MLESFRELLSSIWQSAIYMGLFTVALWLIYFVDSVVMHNGLKNRFGLKPRSRFNLLAILISPFLHVNRAHLAANSIPFFILGSLVMVQGQLAFWLTTVIVIIVAGLGIWGFGKSGTQHMGASGLILGYFGYLLASAFFSTNLATIIIAVIVAVLYLGLIWQVVPMKKGVSTTGHLFGFIGGIIAAAIVGLI